MNKLINTWFRTHIKTCAQLSRPGKPEIDFQASRKRLCLRRYSKNVSNEGRWRNLTSVSSHILYTYTKMDGSPYIFRPNCYKQICVCVWSVCVISHFPYNQVKLTSAESLTSKILFKKLVSLTSYNGPTVKYLARFLDSEDAGQVCQYQLVLSSGRLWWPVTGAS